MGCCYGCDLIKSFVDPFSFLMLNSVDRCHLLFLLPAELICRACGVRKMLFLGRCVWSMASRLYIYHSIHLLYCSCVTAIAVYLAVGPYPVCGHIRRESSKDRRCNEYLSPRKLDPNQCSIQPAVDANEVRDPILFMH